MKNLRFLVAALLSCALLTGCMGFIPIGHAIDDFVYEWIPVGGGGGGGVHVVSVEHDGDFECSVDGCTHDHTQDEQFSVPDAK